MRILVYILAALCGYLAGGWNPAITLSRAVYHKDIRECGSKNPGFTNFKRTFGGKLSWVVMALDLLKAAAVIAIFAPLFSEFVSTYQIGAAYTGAFCMLGHAFPALYKFKGGKGFLVYMSMIWFVDWRAGLVATLALAVLLLTTKYMSLSTMLAVTSSVVTLLATGVDHFSVTVICAVEVVFMIVRHKENIKRLVSGTEHKFYLKSKKTEG